MLNYEKLRSQLIKHEGLKRLPYIDSVGKLTIGVGRNLDDKGISNSEALNMLSNDIKIAETDARKLVARFPDLGDVRQRVLIDMAFNLGLGRLSKFKKTLAAIEAGDYKEASLEMLDSKWAAQVGRRANRLALMMATGRE